MAVDTSKIQNSLLSIEEKKVLLAIAEVINDGLEPVEASIAAVETGLTAAGVRLDDLEATVDTAVTGLSAIAADHEARITTLEGA